MLTPLEEHWLRIYRKWQLRDQRRYRHLPKPCGEANELAKAIKERKKKIQDLVKKKRIK